MCDHHNRHLLTLLGERGQQAALALGAPETQIFVATIELMKLQVHGTPPQPFRGAMKVAAGATA